MRTKMSKADAGRAIEALFDDKGIIAAELKKGAKVQITGFGNFEARKRAARMGGNPKTGGVIQIKASIAPAFRAGKQLKQVVNKKQAVNITTLLISGCPSGRPVGSLNGGTP